MLHYQPQVNVDTLEWVGVEALVRWDHPEPGLLAPDTFVPVAEGDPRLMHRFTDYILRQALADLMPATKVGGFEGRISLNVTADVLATAEFPARLAAIASAAGVNIDRLVLEVTETTLPTDPVRARAIVRNSIRLARADPGQAGGGGSPPGHTLDLLRDPDGLDFASVEAYAQSLRGALHLRRDEAGHPHPRIRLLLPLDD